MKVPQQTNINKLLRKASSSRDTTVLPTLLQSYDISTSDLEKPSSDGKNALHMACWMGCIENVSLLLSLGCDVNAISTGKHNYGKSPIFYAITRGREDVVRYLLLDHERSRVNVRIVNNKGQSVYSMAYSHDISVDILESIRSRESDGLVVHAFANDLKGWMDYSVSHSDGCIYGDLDVRFLARPLTDEDVVKDGIVVNPTTKESRRGNFAKNNPSAVVADGPDKSNRKYMSGKKEHQKTEQIQQLSTEQQFQLGQLWNNVTLSLQENNSWDLFSSLLAIVQLFEGSNVRLPWISYSSSRLDFLIKVEIAEAELLHSTSVEETTERVRTNISYESLLSEAKVYCGSGDRHATLVKRILSKANDDSSTQTNEQVRSRHDAEALISMQQDQIVQLWKDIDASLEKRNPNEIYLALIKPIIFCDGKIIKDWMQDHMHQLHSVLESKSIKENDVIMHQVLQLCGLNGSRYSLLLKRLITRSHVELNENVVIPRTSAPSKKKHELSSSYKSFLNALCREYTNGSDLPSWDVLMNPYLASKVTHCHLSLPEPPVFVDSSAGISRLDTKLRKIAAAYNFNSQIDENTQEMIVQFNQLIAFDSEFCTSDEGDTQIATIQFSVLDNSVPSAWVVDLLVQDEDYYSITCNFLRWLFQESKSHIIGFSPRHDLHLLSSYLGHDIDSTSVWDVQLLAAYDMAEDTVSAETKKSVMASMPGLKSCCSYYLNDSTWMLSKDQQCSNWKKRPLSVDQLGYAALDAAVLLVLLSELARRC